MAFNILPVIKFISQSKGIADTVNSLVKQYKEIKQGGFDDSEIKKALEVQAALNEQLENQIKVIGKAIEDLERSVKTLRSLIYVALFLSVAAMTLSVLL